MAGLNQGVLLGGNALFKEFKGALTEQYVFQQLKTIPDLQIHYWTAERGNAEVNFVISDGRSVVPVEVKAEVNLQAKSLRVFREQYKLELSVRTATTDCRKQDWLVNVPLWAIGAVDRLFSS